jgi:acyl-CoA thioesterase FadM
VGMPRGAVYRTFPSRASTTELMRKRRCGDSQSISYPTPSSPLYLPLHADTPAHSLDSFAHVNNARYITFFETGRMQFIQALLPELEPGSEDWLVKGKPGGPGVILGSISARYKRPVMFPDTLLVAHRVTDISRDRFQMEHICYSFA